MLQFIIKVPASGLSVAVVATIARRYPGFGGLVASLPLVLLLGMIWLRQDTRDPVTRAAHARATFWFVLPSLPILLFIPVMLEWGRSFWTTLLASCMLTIALYIGKLWAATRFELRL